MRFHLASLAALLPLALAADSSSSGPPASVTGQFGFTALTYTDDKDYFNYLTSKGWKPAAASYHITARESNTALENALEDFESQHFSFVLTGSLATVTGTWNVEQGLEAYEQQITAAPSQDRSLISSYYNEEIHLQTAAAAPTDLALSAGIAGVVAAAAGLAVAL